MAKLKLQPTNLKALLCLLQVGTDSYIFSPHEIKQLYLSFSCKDLTKVSEALSHLPDVLS